MPNDGKTCCPKCGSEEAVAKSVAWDAAASIPPKIAKELDRLHAVEIAARALISSSPHPGSEETVVVTVPLSMLDRLALATGIKMDR